MQGVWWGWASIRRAGAALAQPPPHPQRGSSSIAPGSGRVVGGAAGRHWLEVHGIEMGSSSRGWAPCPAGSSLPGWPCSSCPREQAAAPPKRRLAAAFSSWAPGGQAWLVPQMRPCRPCAHCHGRQRLWGALQGPRHHPDLVFYPQGASAP